MRSDYCTSVCVLRVSIGCYFDILELFTEIVSVLYIPIIFFKDTFDVLTKYVDKKCMKLTA